MALVGGIKGTEKGTGEKGTGKKVHKTAWIGKTNIFLKMKTNNKKPLRIRTLAYVRDI